jgi:hypothetical protein
MQLRPLIVGLGSTVVGSGVLASLLLSPAQAGSARVVDVILSVGTPSGSSTCQPDSEAACEMVRVRLDLTTGVASKVVTLVGKAAVGASGSGVAEPAVSPDGTRVAWLERGGQGVQLWAKAFAESGAHLIVKSGRKQNGGSGLRPEWPEWLGNDTLLFSSKTGSSDGKEDKTIFSVSVADLSRPGDPVARAGAGVSGWTGAQDPAVYAGSSSTQLVAFGPVPGGSSEAYQLKLAPIDSSGRPTSGPTIVAAGKNAAGRDIVGCHHPAWNASGDRITCMVHSPSESIGGISTKLLYSYARDAAGRWSLAGRAFEPVTPTAAGLAVASRLTADAGCQVLTWKYAQYCQSDDYLVATLYCSLGGKSGRRGAEIGASRVLIVHTNPVEYFDVTAMVEADAGVPVGTMSSFTGTCRAVD